MNIALAQENKRTLFWILSPIYGMAFLLFAANFYSFGVSSSVSSILLGILLFGPLYGIASVFLDALVFKLTDPWFGGQSNIASLSIAIGYSKAPAFLLLTVWGALLISDSSRAFIHNASNDSAVAIIFSTLIVSIWSLFLLTKHLQNLQDFTFTRALAYTLTNYLLLFSVYVIILFAGRYIYISYL